jgi:hypothetical protein
MSIRQGGLAKLPARQAFDNRLEQRQLQFPDAGSFEGSKGRRSLQSECAEWILVGHMSNTGGMFDGSTNGFDPGHRFGSFFAEPIPATPDFYGPFPDPADPVFYRPFPNETPVNIKFMTGDGHVEAVTNYNALKALIDADSDTEAIIAFTVIERNEGLIATESDVMGAVLSGSASLDYPMITYAPTIALGFDRGQMLWSENNGPGEELKNEHGGINVYIAKCDPPTTPPDLEDDPLSNMGSFTDETNLVEVPDWGDSFDGYYSLTSGYTGSPPTGSQFIQRRLIMQIYSQQAGVTIDAGQSCPSVNSEALKVGNDIRGNGPFIQATGLEIITMFNSGGSNNDFSSGSIDFSFRFTSGFGTGSTINFYRGTDTGGSASYQFCVRQVLQLEYGGKVSVIDVMEVPLSFTIDLNGAFVLADGFDVQSVSVAERTETITSSYTAEIYRCSFPEAPTEEISIEYRQGDVVELCIRSSNYPLASVVNILSLEFAITNIAGVSATHQAIGSPLTDFDESTDCGIFEKTADVFEQICGVRVLLPINIFFEAGTGSGTRDVAVTGTSLLQVGDSAGRRLATVGGSSGRRELQQGGEQEASFSMSVETVVPENSGGFSMIVASVTGAMAVAIATLLM